MRIPRFAMWSLALVAGALLSWSVTALAQEQPSADGDVDPPGVTVMQRGPVHEAFAQPSSARPEPAQVVAKKPPAPIAEVPPDRKPKGDDVLWIPGYWAWDMEKRDFLWVSGTWRVPPPGRKWVPGYWHEAEEGWQWVSGLWAAQNRDVIAYVATPPASMENGASAPAPDDDSSWVPGTWLWRDGAWAWRPGFWNTNYGGWTYTPSGYFWTPYGCIYNGGYWDYTLEDRGLLFAPVCFGAGFGGPYTPWCVVGIGGLFDNLWFGPGCYWFGNCYGPFWRACGFRPWCFQGALAHDGLFAHQAWVNRANANWAANARSNFLARQNGRVAGPASTFNGRTASSQVAAAGGNGVGHTSNQNLVTPLNQLSNRSSLTRASTEQLNQARQSGNTLRQASTARGWNEGSQAAMHGSGGGNTLRMPAQLSSNSVNNSLGTRGLTGMNSPWSGQNNGAGPHAYNPGATGYHAAPGGYGPRVSAYSGAGGGYHGGAGYHGGGGGGGHGGGHR